jgi:hypothetical protein
MKKIWDEIVLFYESAKSFVVKALGVFKDSTGKVSWKRVSGAAALVVGFRQLLIGDHFGALVCIVYAAVMGTIAALTGK